MAVKIKTKIATSAGKIPDTLITGEMAVDPYLGKIWYLSSDTGHHTALAQEVHFGASGANVPNPQPGLLWWQTDKNQLMVYVGNVSGTADQWQPVGVGLAGGTINGHMKIEIDGFTYFETSDDVSDVEAELPGIYTEGKLRCDADLSVGGNAAIGGTLSVTGVTQFSDTVNIGSSTEEVGFNLFAQASVGTLLRRGQAGHYANATGSPGAASPLISIASTIPTDDLGDDGDIWFKI